MFSVDASEIEKGNKYQVTLSSCVDGDTAKFNLNDEIITVRFLAVDTPETKHPDKGEEPWGKEASEYTCSNLKKGNIIEIEYDLNSDIKDKYDRHLGWIWIDGVLLQNSLVELGYAKVAYLYGDYDYTDNLLLLESNAKSNNLGIWGENPPDYTIYYLIGGLVLFLTVCILSSKFKNKNLNKVKRKMKSNLTKQIKKSIK